MTLISKKHGPHSALFWIALLCVVFMPLRPAMASGTTSGESGIRTIWVATLQLMAEQMTATMTAQVEAIGLFLDAKHQLETQRLLQEKTAQAHKDYQPSAQMCTFGTLTRDLGKTNRNVSLSRTALSAYMLSRQTGEKDRISSSKISDSLVRMKRFRKEFCNPSDNANGLSAFCPHGPQKLEMADRDIDYTRSVDSRKTLDLDQTDKAISDDETSVYALLDNLFMNEPIPRLPSKPLEQQKYKYHYMNLRSIMAMRGIAENSMANIIALKTASPKQEEGSAAPYLKALMAEFGLDDKTIVGLLGEHPSYYAQMELLTKTIYQNPSFYTNLYDKPVNVTRIRTAMQAIKLMNDRDIHDALMRREMLLSLIYEVRLRQHAEGIYDRVEGTVFRKSTAE